MGAPSLPGQAPPDLVANKAVALDIIGEHVREFMGHMSYAERCKVTRLDFHAQREVTTVAGPRGVHLPVTHTRTATCQRRSPRAGQSCSPVERQAAMDNVPPDEMIARIAFEEERRQAAMIANTSKSDEQLAGSLDKSQDK